MGRHSWRRTHALVQPARCGSLAAVIVVLDRPVSSLPLVREVRGDERLPQWPLRERCQERGGLARGEDAYGTIPSCYTAGLAGWTGSYGRQSDPWPCRSVASPDGLAAALRAGGDRCTGGGGRIARSRFSLCARRSRPQLRAPPGDDPVAPGGGGPRHPRRTPAVEALPRAPLLALGPLDLSWHRAAYWDGRAHPVWHASLLALDGQ